jgi:hypothetical protein
VREKPALLEDISDPPQMGRDADAALGIEQNRAVHDDAPPTRTEQAGDRVYDGSLSGARAAEQSDQTAPGMKMDVEREIGEPVLDIDFEHCGSVTRKAPAQAACRKIGGEQRDK